MQTSRVYRLILSALLVPTAFGCGEYLSDAEWNEIVSDATLHNYGRITMVNGNHLHGYLLSVRTDSLEWYDTTAPVESRHHVISANEVKDVFVLQPNGTRLLHFGLAGCAAGGLAGCLLQEGYEHSAEPITNGTLSNLTASTVILGATGAALGTVIGGVTDRGTYVNVWQSRYNY